jgi:hypothetical protein
MNVTEVIEHGQADTYKAEVVKEAIGVVGAIVPWNFPLLMATWKLAPALAAGCTIILKPSELTPISAIEFGHICNAVGLPKGVVNIIPGLGSEAGEALAMSKGVDKISFTGSVPTGRKIMMAASYGPVPVTLELGGKSPMILLEDAMNKEGRQDVIEWIKVGQKSVGLEQPKLIVIRLSSLAFSSTKAKSAPPPPVSSPTTALPTKSSRNSSRKPRPSKSDPDSTLAAKWVL